MENIIHGPLVRGADILQSKRHDYILKQPHRTWDSECSLVYVFWSHKNLVVTGIAIHEAQDLMTSRCVDATGIGYSSFGVALLRSRKSMETRHRPSFFSTGTILETTQHTCMA